MQMKHADFVRIAFLLPTFVGWGNGVAKDQMFFVAYFCAHSKRRRCSQTGNVTVTSITALPAGISLLKQFNINNY